jgi:hypothetical protein
MLMHRSLQLLLLLLLLLLVHMPTAMAQQVDTRLCTSCDSCVCLPG